MQFIQPSARLQRLYQIRSLRTLDTAKKPGVTLLYVMPGGGFRFARKVAGESLPGFGTDWIVKSARRSSVKNWRPIPPSGSSVPSLKMDTGISVLAPVLGITNLRH